MYHVNHYFTYSVSNKRTINLPFNMARIIVQITIYCRLWIGRDGLEVRCLRYIVICIDLKETLTQCCFNVGPSSAIAVRR